MKLGFTYLTLNSTDIILIQNIITLLNNEFTIIGDINFKSNKIIQKFPHFPGEDSLQVGFVSKKTIKVNSIAAPSDHRFVIGEMKIFDNLMRSLKIGEISYEVSKNIVFEIPHGKIPKFIPKVSIPQYHVGLTDRERSINIVIDKRKLFEKFNYLWKYDRREPFLGKSVPKVLELLMLNI